MCWRVKGPVLVVVGVAIYIRERALRKYLTATRERERSYAVCVYTGNEPRMYMHVAVRSSEDNRGSERGCKSERKRISP